MQACFGRLDLDSAQEHRDVDTSGGHFSGFMDTTSGVWLLLDLTTTTVVFLCSILCKNYLD